MKKEQVKKFNTCGLEVSIPIYIKSIFDVMEERGLPYGSFKELAHYELERSFYLSESAYLAGTNKELFDLFDVHPDEKTAFGVEIPSSERMEQFRNEFPKFKKIIETAEEIEEEIYYISNGVTMGYIVLTSSYNRETKHIHREIHHGVSQDPTKETWSATSNNTNNKYIYEDVFIVD